MIITKTPFRMSFFGGGTDMPVFFEEYGGSVLSTTIDKYCYISSRILPPFFEYKTHLAYSKIEKIKELDEIEHPLIRNTLKYMNMNNVSILYDADLPARSGLGTSSSFAVGLLNGLHQLQGEEYTKQELAKEAIFVERELCNEAGGWQDQIAAAYGGFNRIDFRNGEFFVNPVKISEVKKEALNQNLLMFFTGFSRFSSTISEKQIKATKDKTLELREMLTLVNEAQGILEGKEDIKEFGRLLDYTWSLKKSLTNSISNSELDQIYKRAIMSGALGGKLLGAGGGGFYIFYVEPEKQEKVKQELKDLLYIPFSFDNEGTVVLKTKR